jgi:hypothetical protein
MGHRSIQVTVDIYGHLVPGGNRAAVERLDDQATPRSATPVQPDAVTNDQNESLSRVESVVSRVGIVPERRGRSLSA